MSSIIAARFETFEQAKVAANALMDNGVQGEDLHTFYVNPPGEHDRYPIGGDRRSDPEATGAMQGAFSGAAALGVIGAVVGALIGFTLGNSLLPVAAGAGVGAYVGSLMGGLSMLGRNKPVDASPTPATSGVQGARHSGVLLAVRADTLQHQSVTEILRQHGGIEIERAQGRWEAGQWQDFDPLAAHYDVEPSTSGPGVTTTTHDVQSR